MNIAEAKSKLSELVVAAEQGQNVVIARRGHLVVWLISTGSVYDVLDGI